MGKVKTHIPIKFEKLEEHKVEDTRFTKVRIDLMHTGQNYNGSYFTREVVENAIPSLANTPILAYIEPNSEGEVDASDHRMSTEKNESGDIEYKVKGVPYGLIPENNNARIETKVCEDGTEREFLTVEGLLWNKWDDMTDILDRDMAKHQSMELHDNYSGYFEEDTNLFHFTEFKFYGACILGMDYMPAMTDSVIELDFDKSSMKELNKYMQGKMEQFKTYSLKKRDLGKGGEVLKEKLELLEKFSVSKEDIEKLGEDLEELTLEELKSKIKDLLEKVEESETEEVEDKEIEEIESVEEEVVEPLGVEIEEIEEVEVEEVEEELGDIEKMTLEELRVVVKDLLEKIESLEQDELDEEIGEIANEEVEELIEFKTKYEELEKEVVELREFKDNAIAKKRAEEESSLFAKYESLSDLEEYKALKEKSNEFEDITELEKELALLFVRNNVKDEPKVKEESSIKFNLEEGDNDTDKRYGDLFEKYSK